MGCTELPPTLLAPHGTGSARKRQANMSKEVAAQILVPSSVGFQDSNEDVYAEQGGQNRCWLEKIMRMKESDKISEQ